MRRAMTYVHKTLIRNPMRTTRHATRHATCHALFCLSVLLTPCAHVEAQEGEEGTAHGLDDTLPLVTHDLEHSKRNLQDIQERIDAAYGRHRLYQARSRAIEEEIAALRLELNAQTAQEQHVTQKQRAIERLIEAYHLAISEQKTLLQEQKKSIDRLVIILQHYALRPPSFAFFRPKEADTSIRHAILLRTLYPQFVAQATRHQRAMTSIHALIEKTSTEQKRLQELEKELLQEKRAMQLLIARKGQHRQQMTQSASVALRRAETLKAQARDLRQFIDKLILEEQEKQRQRQALKEREQRDNKEPAASNDIPSPQKPPPPTSPTTHAKKSPPPQHKERPSFHAPYRHAQQAKGKLTPPSTGRVVNRFREKTPHVYSEGVVIETGFNATIKACDDGKVLYAGTFRTYGHMVILSHHQDLVSIVSGMHGVLVSVEDLVAQGQPIGFMHRASDVAQGQNAPRLYMELRLRGIPIDPVAWLSSSIGQGHDSDNKI